MTAPDALLRECNRCHESKPLDAFRRDAQRLSGHQGTCKECALPSVRAASRASRERHLDRRREAERAKARRRYNAEANTARNQTPKGRTRAALRNAVADGRIAKPSACEGCGATDAILGGHHHLGYDRPLDVQWLCSVCHGLQHRKAA
jgi:hypothetical protein